MEPTTSALARALDDASTNDEALETPHLEGPQDRKTQPDSAASGRPELLDEKSWSTLQAKAALAGVALYRVGDGSGGEVFIARRWGLSRQLDDIDELETFLARAEELAP